MKQHTRMISKVLAGAIFCAAGSAGVATADTTFTYTLGALSEDYLGRSEQFGHIPFNGLSVNASGSSGQLDYSLTLAAQRERPRDYVPEFDLSYRFGGDVWKIGVGKEERHWSPSRHTSLILSRNAESFPAIYLRKTEATQSDSALLRWVGPWSGEVFLGQTNDSLHGGTEALLMGMRVVFEPSENFQFSLVRTLQFGGAGQPKDSETILRALLGQTNEGAAGGANQMAGLGASYTFAPGPSSTRVYAQIIGEDEAGGLPNCFLRLAGVEKQATLFGAPSIISLEAVDTRVPRTSGGNCGRGVAYNNSLYDYTNSGTVLGAAIDSESSSVNLRVTHEFDKWSMDWGIGYYEINSGQVATHRLSSTSTEGATVSVGADIDLGAGTLSGVMAWQDFDLDTAGFSKGLRVGLGYSASF